MELTSGQTLSRQNSLSHIYPLTYPVSSPTALASTFQDVWHDRLGHSGAPFFDFLASCKIIPCNKHAKTLVCNSCQLSKHKRLPSFTSQSITILPFDIVHCDLWTSHVLSKAGYKYYVVLVDDFTQYTWVFPLKFKSETFAKFTQFHKYIKTQFHTSIKGEFDNHNFKSFAHSQGLQFRFSCPHASQQNGKSKRMIRRLNKIILTLLTHASLLPNFWVEALHTACYLHNILPTNLLKFQTPASALYLRQPSYFHFRVLVPSLPDTDVIRCMWLFLLKFNSQGTLQRYKARLVINGKNQQIGIDCDETFSPVVKPTTIRTILSFAVSRGWPIHQLDVKNAFLHATYRRQLTKSLYGLKQIGLLLLFKSVDSAVPLVTLLCSSSPKANKHQAYLLLYVDDIILTALDTQFLQHIITMLSKEFSKADLASGILSRANMFDCKPSTTPIDTASKFSSTQCQLLPNGTLYRQLVGALQYLTFTRPDLTYDVQQICLFMNAPRDTHFQFMKRVLRYLKGTLSYRLSISPFKSHRFTAYSDADWGDASIPKDLHQVIVSSLAQTSYLGLPKRKPTIS
ncbi:hypothetical protein OSB04_011252 [Centaurea solstitialis]|uniref:Integrase catalytic domain-containing protein n=1 Tax=Centaurea solstitialis TaxID=347529 RepID=A0AA38TGM4_9ASTR|nr:hypothetical protein OSB04_011252 [Centaurea solstitialis]